MVACTFVVASHRLRQTVELLVGVLHVGRHLHLINLPLLDDGSTWFVISDMAQILSYLNVRFLKCFDPFL